MTLKSGRQLTLGLALIAAFAAPAAHAFFDDNEARRAIVELRNQVRMLEDKVKRLETANQGQLAIAQQLSDKDIEIAKLRGELEVANNNIRRLQDDNKVLYTNLDDRLRKLEPKTVQLDGQDLDVPPQQYAAYDAGLDHFKSANYVEAAKQFQAFLDEYKGSKLEPQVRYFLGSAQFAQGEYKTALITQRDLARDFPDSPRAPDALLSMASSQLELKSIPGAKKTLTDLIAKYPDSAAAASAKARLDAIK